VLLFLLEWSNDESILYYYYYVFFDKVILIMRGILVSSKYDSLAKWVAVLKTESCTAERE